ncbi:hypothetical protein ACJ72_05573 [Emergomyces africanus]|uniref:Uncharacterized protein n=1 Tax=Emergomyces africanus TaxID=1955775 RepID=A0A1B7NTI3_9EURO|nr:hypothetical protein ACJ72_05573 [Emergomyces africanus]
MTTSYTIELLTSPADAPIIGKIKTEAFESSTLSRYAFCWEGEGKALVEKWYTDREEQDLQDPNQYTIISVSAGEGAISGDTSLNTNYYTITFNSLIRSDFFNISYAVDP